MIDTDTYVNRTIDLLTDEVGKDVIMHILLQKWPVDYLYGVVKKELVNSRRKKSRNALSRTNRRIIVNALDQNTCVYCGKELDYYEIDHITCIEDLGTDELDNIATACHACNREKGERPREESRKHILKRRDEFVRAKMNEHFQTKKGRILLKKFLMDTYFE
jgi:CRISPR/Cas system Type II protein with McrA/HNH and RuvC-like nuclease domain